MMSPLDSPSSLSSIWSALALGIHGLMDSTHLATGLLGLGADCIARIRDQHSACPGALGLNV